MCLYSCGEISEIENYQNLNSTFALSKLSSLNSDEVAYATSLCNALVIKETTLRNSYVSRFFNYKSSIKTCESDEATSKPISLLLQSSLIFTTNLDTEYAFLTPELSDNNSTFSKFCQNGFSSRFISSLDEVYHFNITKRDSEYELTVLTSYYHEVVDGVRNYKIYKRDELTFNAISSKNRPVGLMTNRVLSTTSNCTDTSSEYVKSTSLTSITD